MFYELEAYARTEMYQRYQIFDINASRDIRLLAVARGIIQVWLSRFLRDSNKIQIEFEDSQDVHI